MRSRVLRYLLVMLTSISIRCVAQETILTFDMAEEINSTAWIHVQGALRKAQKVEANHIVIRMNTYGGELVYADSIRQAILNCQTPIYVFVDANAASAGALIATACDSIFMCPGGSIGAATVVNGTDGSKMPDKYQSYMRAMMRSTAEAHPHADPQDTARHYLRNPRIAEAFVDEAVCIAGLVDSDHILTLTSNEALRVGYCEAIMNDLTDVCEHVANGAKIVHYSPSIFEDMKGGLLSTGFRGILILLIIGGLYFELQTPGIGFALLTSAVAALLYFAPLYIDGLAANWEIALFLIGIGLLAVEILVIPGFGIAGIGGIACIVISLAVSLVNNDGLDFETVAPHAFTHSLLFVLVSLIVSIALCIVLGRVLYKGRKTGPLAGVVLGKSQEINEGYVGVEKDVVDSKIGKTGTAKTDLRPGGKVLIDNETIDAISNGEYIEKGTTIKVIASSSGQIVVEKTNENQNT